jgi:TolB-like protein
MGAVPTFSTEEINLELQRALSFPTFKSSPTLSKFLEYIVLETVNGREQYIKEYSIAVEVLNRPTTFNSHDDAVVRIHAGRLRRTLNEYYLTDGINNPFSIFIPKGNYVPQFRHIEKARENSFIADTLHNAEAKPVVAIFPFKLTPKTEDTALFSLVLREELSAELSRFEDISVIGYHSKEIIAKINENILEAGKLVGADYIIAGSLQYAEQRIRIRANLLITATGEVLMTKSVDREIKNGLFEIQDEIVQNVVSAVGGYYGFIYQEMAKAAPEKFTSNISTWQGIYAYYLYERSFTVERYTNALSALENSVKTNPGHALSWAMLGELYLDGAALGIVNVERPVEEGYHCAMQALKLDPRCQHGWHTLTWVNLFKGDKESCYDSAMQCIQLNPNSSVMVLGVGIMLFCAGYFDEGFPIIERAIKNTLYCPWRINGGFCIYFLWKKDYANAFYWAEKMDSGENFWEPLLKAVSLAYMNEDTAAKKELIKLLRIEPDTPAQLHRMLSNFLLSEELKETIVDGLHMAGLRPDVLGIRA